jgi:hypothetical protein
MWSVASIITAECTEGRERERERERKKEEEEERRKKERKRGYWEDGG